MTIAFATQTQTDQPHRIVIRSIGTAAPSSAGSIALGLGVPVRQVTEALYRAPTVLVDGLPPDTARTMADLLADLGCEVEVAPSDAPLPKPGPLFDVALHIHDTRRYSDIVDQLGQFLGTSAEESRKLVATAPAIVLGGVSRATIDALAARLGEGADLIASDPGAALYDLFLGETDATVRARILGDLRRRKLTLLSETGCLVTGLDKAQADQLWSQHHRSRALRVVNRDFLRFDLVLTGGDATPQTLSALAAETDIPTDILPRLFTALPISILEAVPGNRIEASMDVLAQAGLALRADLVTFQHLGIEITRAPVVAPIVRTLRALGIDGADAALRRLPYRLPYSLPELQARIVRDALTESGAVVDLFDPTEEAA